MTLSSSCSYPSRGLITAALDQTNALPAPVTKGAVCMYMCACKNEWVSMKSGPWTLVGDLCHKTAWQLLQADKHYLPHNS